MKKVLGCLVLVVAAVLIFWTPSVYADCQDSYYYCFRSLDDYHKYGTDNWHYQAPVGNCWKDSWCSICGGEGNYYKAADACKRKYPEYLNGVEPIACIAAILFDGNSKGHKKCWDVYGRQIY